jgi:hypothetical protein
MGRRGRRTVPCPVSSGVTEGASVEAGAPEGFEPLGRTSPLVELLGPFHSRGTGADLALGLRVVEEHTNARSFAHGAVLLTFADVAPGVSLCLFKAQTLLCSSCA